MRILSLRPPEIEVVTVLIGLDTTDIWKISEGGSTKPVDFLELAASAMGDNENVNIPAIGMIIVKAETDEDMMEHVSRIVAKMAPGRTAHIRVVEDWYDGK